MFLFTTYSRYMIDLIAIVLIKAWQSVKLEVGDNRGISKRPLKRKSGDILRYVLKQIREQMGLEYNFASCMDQV